MAPLHEEKDQIQYVQLFDNMGPKNRYVVHSIAWKEL